jgi:bacteriorhodopsin
MWIVYVAWVFVVGLMAVVEADATSVVAGLMTFIFYCVLPLSIINYLAGSPRRRAKINAAAAAAAAARAAAAKPDTDASID